MLRQVMCATAALLIMLGLLIPSESWSDINFRSSKPLGTHEYILHFTANEGVDSISDPIPSCLSMTVYWDRGTVGAVSLFETDWDDDTVSEVEASTLIKAFTTSTKFGTFSPTKSSVRFVVDTVETTLPSTASVRCSNLIIS